MSKCGHGAIAPERRSDSRASATNHGPASPEFDSAREVIDTAPDGFIGLDTEGVVTQWNLAAAQMFGIPLEAAVGATLAELIVPDRYRAAHEAGLRRYVQSGVGHVVGSPVQVEARHADGHEFPIELTIWPRKRGDSLSFYAFVRDVSERVAAQEALAQLAAIVTSSPDAILSTDLDGTIRTWNAGADRVYGYPAAQMVGSSLARLIPPDRQGELGMIISTVASGQSVEMETVRVRADGTRVEVSLACSPVRDASGTVVRLAYVARDITTAKSTERHLRETQAALTRQAEVMKHRAFHDPLTGLANRALLLDRAEHALSQARRDQAMVLLMMIDVDDFKVVNDTLGHSFGDRLLCAIADRLRSLVRAGDTVARLGGDEFAILLEHASEEESSALAERITEALSKPVRLDRERVSCRVSLGIADNRAVTGPVHDESDTAVDVETLLRHADLAMYAAKNAGKAGWRYYDPGLQAGLAHRLRLETELRTAMEAGEFRLCYQPICDPTTQRAVGLEALLRWQPPGREPVPPSEFIPVLEQSGLIVPVGAWVLAQACEQAVRLTEAGHDLGMSVNVSARQLSDPGFVTTIQEVLATTGLEPSRLTLEVTETLLIGPVDEVRERLAGLRLLGVHIAVDDFGTGHSSLARLRSLPVTSLKVDKSFIHDLDAHAGDIAILQAVVGMAHALGLPVVAEGVETNHQLLRLTELGFDTVQGFRLAKPLTPEDLQTYLAAQRAHSTTPRPAQIGA